MSEEYKNREVRKNRLVFPSFYYPSDCETEGTDEQERASEEEEVERQIRKNIHPED